MTNNKYRISFEVEDNWDMGGFRNFIKFLLSEDNLYEVFIISNAEDSMLINTIGQSLGLNSAHIIITNFEQDKVQAIINNNIDIHFDNLQSTVLLITETTENSYGVLVTPNLNKYYLEPDYILVFERYKRTILDELQNSQ